MVKTFYKQIVNILNSFYLLFHSDINYSKSFFYYFKVSIAKQNHLIVTKSTIQKSLIVIEGVNNEIIANEAFIASCNISINGKNNKIILKDGVKLRKGIINIRGSNCNIIIGENTSFGQVRMINVGKNNDVIIGRDCLFADHIEIWASDTHSIYDKYGNFINPEKPIIIGNNVWIGSYVKILKGITIGDNTIVGLNSFVTKNIESGILCAGNPLRVLRSEVSWTLKYENE